MLVRQVERVVMVIFPLLFIPPVPNFLSQLSLQLNYYLVNDAVAALPQLARHLRAPAAIPCSGVV